MNLNEHKERSLCKSPSASSHNFISDTAKMEMRNRQHTEFRSQISGIVGPLGEKFDFLVPWDLTFQDIVIRKPQKSGSGFKIQCIAFERYFSLTIQEICLRNVCVFYKLKRFSILWNCHGQIDKITDGGRSLV